MRKGLFLFLVLFTGLTLVAQQPGKKLPGIYPQKKYFPKSSLAKNLSETCGNGLDDDGNGLKDCEDYSCYFSDPVVCNCAPIDVIWINSGSDLLWINPVTGVERYIGDMGRYMGDITWAPDGKLYGVDYDSCKIWQIDPVTAQITFVTSIAGYDFSNAMTSDANGDLYLAARVTFTAPPSVNHIIKVKLSTGPVTFVADISNIGTYSAGDLAFHNGTLYLACISNILAKIDITTGVVATNPILGLPPDADIWGIVGKANGTLYISDADDLFSININTMQATPYYTTTTPMFIWGMANFNDYCLAPVCQSTVDIEVQSNEPYCNDPGVQLKANGTGLAGPVAYKWTKPDGTFSSSQTITATEAGKYMVRYSTIPDTCSVEDTIVLEFDKTPKARLGADTILCTGTQITLIPSDTSAITSYLWQDGSINPVLIIDQPGLYWLESANVCATYRDSIIVTGRKFANVDLGPGAELCEYDTLHIQNLLDEPGYTYKWSDNTTGKVMVIPAPGKYWVDVKNICGTVSDTIIISKKIDDCTCFLYVPTGYTPNNDGRNDLLKAFSNCPVTGVLSIYNRWGQLIYKTNDLQKGWNGVYNGNLQSTGVYVYQVTYSYTLRPGIFYKKGTFVLIR